MTKKREIESDCTHLEAKEDEHRRACFHDFHGADHDECHVHSCQQRHERHQAHVREARDDVRLLDLV